MGCGGCDGEKGRVFVDVLEEIGWGKVGVMLLIGGVKGGGGGVEGEGRSVMERLVVVVGKGVGFRFEGIDM